MKYDILNRWSGKVQVTAEIDCGEDARPSIKLGLAAQWAVKEKADLSEAALSEADLSGADLSRAYLSRTDLSGADLRDADLRGANLFGADLFGANLSGANLFGAYLSRTDLSGADLRDADLRDANLSDAYLRGAIIAEGVKLIGDRPFLSIGPIGSRRDDLRSFITNKGVMVMTGPGRPACFFGTLDQFRAAVLDKHGDRAHGREYSAAIKMIEVHAEIWTPADADAAETAVATCGATSAACGATLTNATSATPSEMQASTWLT